MSVQGPARAKEREAERRDIQRATADPPNEENEECKKVDWSLELNVTPLETTVATRVGSNVIFLRDSLELSFQGWCAYFLYTASFGERWEMSGFFRTQKACISNWCFTIECICLNFPLCWGVSFYTLQAPREGRLFGDSTQPTVKKEGSIGNLFAHFAMNALIRLGRVYL